MGQKQVLSGNVALAEAAVRAGCKFFSGYPITPQTAITEYLSWRIPEVGGEYIQAESEVAAVNMVIGASMVGTRAMTATSCQGLSLMAEGMSSLAAAGYPSVIVDVQRAGPGTSTITASQCDYNFVTKSIGHGGLRAYVLGPSTVQEEVDFTYMAFDFADRERTIVIVMTDGMLGEMMEPVELPEFKTEFPEKEWVVTGRENFRPKVLLRDSLKPVPLAEKKLTEYFEKYKKWEREDCLVEELFIDDAEVIVAAWGSVARIALSTVEELREEGYKVGLIRPITIYPFPIKSFRKLDPTKVKSIVVAEMSMPPQMYYDVEKAVQEKIPLEYCFRAAGMIITSDDIKEVVKKKF